MLIIPAIYLKNGQCVSLKYDALQDAVCISDDPIDMAGRWFDKGVRRLHMVDLDGAFQGAPQNEELIAQIALRFPNFPLQVGGGIRDLDTVERYLRSGVDYVILSSSVFADPELVVEACQSFSDRIILSLDAKAGKLAVDGWSKILDTSAIDLVNEIDTDGVSSIIYTDIERHGNKAGVNVDATIRLAQASSVPVMASGGVADMNDIRILSALSHEGIGGAIVGHALYDTAESERTLDIVEAQQYCDHQRKS